MIMVSLMKITVDRDCSLTENNPPLTPPGRGTNLTNIEYSYITYRQYNCTFFTRTYLSEEGRIL